LIPVQSGMLRCRNDFFVIRGNGGWLIELFLWLPALPGRFIPGWEGGKIRVVDCCFALGVVPGVLGLLSIAPGVVGRLATRSSSS